MCVGGEGKLHMRTRSPCLAQVWRNMRVHDVRMLGSRKSTSSLVGAPNRFWRVVSLASLYICFEASMIELFMLDLVMFMIYLFRKLIMQLPNNSTIQKLYYRQYVDFTMAGFVDALSPDKSTGVHFKKWQVKVHLWLTMMHAWEARLGILADEHSSEERWKFTDANDLFVGCVKSVLADRLIDVLMHITDANELWDASVAKYDATNAGNELYTMESFHDFRMVKVTPQSQIWLSSTLRVMISGWWM